jgi:hypothetical protein
VVSKRRSTVVGGESDTTGGALTTDAPPAQLPAEPAPDRTAS